VVKASEIAEAFETRVQSEGDPARAAGQKAYLKSELTHFGADTGTIRAAAKDLHRANPDLTHRAVIALVKRLWRKPTYELRAGAVEFLLLYRTLLRGEDIELIEAMLRQAKTWALVDILAASVAGAMVENDQQLNTVLDRWATDGDFWIRRSALLALLRPLRRGEGDFTRFGRYADAMLEEKEFFIRKAIGWVLRETAKKRPELVVEWLEPRAARASGVTMREAVKPLPPADADRLMETYKSRKSPSKAATASG
jgi:3-methyladenine DNA glycosylase AlkD